MFLTTSCVDLTQEPQSFITEEEYIASMDLTGLQQAATALYNDLWNGNYGSTAAYNVSMYVRMILSTVQQKPTTNWRIITD